MNYPMKDGQIDPEFLEKVFERADNTFFSGVEDVLKAAQEVMQEMEPKHDIKVGDQVRTVGVPTFGTSAQVVSIEGDTANIIWGLVSRPAPYKVNELVKTKEAQHGES